MTTNHMLKYHVLVPLAVFLVLIVAGVSLGTALFVGMMSGCIAMMFRPGHGAPRASDDESARDRSHDG
jgi:hypothetical protein